MRRAQRVRFLVLLGIVAALALYVGLNRSPNIECDGCNVIVISIDSLRPDHMSLYGYERATTPTIDAWADTAFVFEKYFANAYLTPMSAAGLHTGLETGRHGVINFQSHLRPGVPMLAERFADEGYTTAAIGNSPEFEIFPALKSNFSRGFSTYRIDTDRRNTPWSDIENWISDAPDPFFLWIPVGQVHWPYGKDAPPQFSDPAYQGVFKNHLLDTSVFNHIYDETLYVPATEDFLRIYGYKSPNEVLLPHYEQFPEPLRGTAVKLDESDMHHIRDAYDNGIAEMDRNIGGFLAWLEDEGYANDTIVIIDSEHGEDLGEHSYVAHYDIFDTTTHVPLIVKIPGTKGGRIGELTSNTDIVPTLADLVGLKEPATDGMSALPLLQESTEKLRDAVFMVRSPLWERLLVVQDSDSHFSKFRAEDDNEYFHDSAIRTKEWKLIHRTARAAEAKYSLWKFIGAKPEVRSEFELYDLVNDPSEQTNVASDHPDVVTSLKARLLEWEKHTWDPRLFPATSPDGQEYF